MGRDGRQADTEYVSHIHREIAEIERREAEFFADVPDNIVAEALRDFFGSPPDGHAYSSKDIDEVRSILKLASDVWTDERIHHLTDRLALKFGYCLQTEPTETAKEHGRTLDSRLLNPARKLIAGFDDPEVKRIYGAPRTYMTQRAQRRVALAIKFLVSEIDGEKRVYRALTAQRKSRISDLKYAFVVDVSKLCETVDHRFRPSRQVNSTREFRGKDEPTKLTEMVELLQRRFNWGESDSFKRPIRKCVDNWNASLKAGRNPKKFRYG